MLVWEMVSQIDFVDSVVAEVVVDDATLALLWLPQESIVIVRGLV